MLKFQQLLDFNIYKQDKWPAFVIQTWNLWFKPEPAELSMKKVL